VLKTALKIEKKFFFEVDPKNRLSYGKKKVKPIWSENFKDFAISLTVFELWQLY